MFGDINTCCKTELGMEEFRYTAEIKPYLPAEVFAMLKKKNADRDITAWVTKKISEGLDFFGFFRYNKLMFKKGEILL